MHEYSLTHHDRTKIYYFIGLISAVLSTGISLWLNKIDTFINVSIAAPSGMVVFLSVFLLFDKLIWKWSLMYRFGIVQIPNVSGVWKGKLDSSLDDDLYDVVLTITQTYTKIRLRLDTATSSSKSHMATIEKVDDSRFTLRWEYFAEPTTPLNSNQFRHYGVTMTLIDGNDGDFKSTMNATYYTEMDRDTSGTIALNYEGK